MHYDLLGKIAEGTRLKRETIANILTHIQAKTFAQFSMNPEAFILQVVEKINLTKDQQLVDKISYTATGGTYPADIFTNAERTASLQENALEVKRSVFTHVIYDSQVEKKFAEDLEAHAGIISVYAKLPRTFLIPTPVGNYNPDWAFVAQEGKMKHIYFVIETKGTADVHDLKPQENYKIQCAKEHFQAICGVEKADFLYTHQDSFEHLLQGEGK